MSEVEWIPPHPPIWAEVFGEDDFGLFAEFELAGVRFVWRWVYPGVFLMGSPQDEKGRWKDEGPQHEVTITKGFWMAETPTTQLQWQAVVGEGSNPSHFTAGKESARCPVESVSWDDSVEFAKKLGEQVAGLSPHLPTEAQWERACRAGTDSAFNDSSLGDWTGALGRLGWYDENSGGKTHPVKGKLANSWGLFDLHGNVWEWCADGRRNYSGDFVDPFESPGESADRVMRGGGWFSPSRFCRSAYRFWNRREIRYQNIGLRLAAGQPAEPGGELQSDGGASRSGGGGPP